MHTSVCTHIHPMVDITMLSWNVWTSNLEGKEHSTVSANRICYSEFSKEHVPKRESARNHECKKSMVSISVGGYKVLC